MPLHTTDALILRTYKLGESDRIVVFLTRDRGKKRGVAKNARQSREAIRRGAGADDVRARRYIEKRAARARAAGLCRDSGGRRCRRRTARRWATSEYFAELIDEWAQEGDPNETLFRLGVSMVEAMAAGVPIEPLARYFESWLLRLQGVYEGRRLSADARAFLEMARSSSPFALERCDGVAQILQELEAAHRELITMHLEKDLKSVRVLREMRR